MATRRPRLARRRVLEGEPPAPAPAAPPATPVPEEVVRVLSVLPGAALVIHVSGAVLRANPRARALGLVRGERISVAHLRELVRRVATDGESREREIRVRRPPLGRGFLELRVQVAQFSPELLLVLAADLSDERRVDAVRRDFVANVSHELKTPVGALSLLSEAILSAADDPESVRRFAERMQSEATRLGNLVNDIIDLSRLQGDDPLVHARPFDVNQVVADATEELRTHALARSIEIVRTEAPDATVLGDRGQVLMAVRNLVSNALAYSPPHTRVAVAVSQADGIVEIDVKDQGIGIPAEDIDRIFERFYRVDPARSRGTGGTGLGLAIVKHVCLNHGGECRVWSEVGVGSTFTLRLPQLADPHDSPPEVPVGSVRGESPS